MNCVKCGRETAEEQVFCETCLSEMENYPVKPGTAIHIPARNVAEEPRKIQHRRKPVRTLSEQVLRLKKRVRRLWIAVVVLLLLCGVLSFAVGRAAVALDIQRLLGQNYHSQGELIKPAETDPLEDRIIP